jgi:hypothetical protein
MIEHPVSAFYVAGVEPLFAQALKRQHVCRGDNALIHAEVAIVYGRRAALTATVGSRARQVRRAVLWPKP